MCLGLVGRIVGLVDGAPDLALVEIAGVRRPINTGLLDPGDVPPPGGWVLVHMGFALQPLTETEAAAALATLDSFAAERHADGAVPANFPE